MTMGSTTMLYATINLMQAMSDLEWDQKLTNLGGHFYQSSYWATFEQAQGRHIVREHGKGWMWQAALRKGRGGITYLYAPYGPVISGKPNEALKSLLAAGHSLKADFVKAEPWGQKNLPSPWQKVTAFQPEYIMRLDISRPEDDLRKNIAQSNRNLINQASARGLQLEVSADPADLPRFMTQQKSTARRGGFTIYADAYYKRLVDSLMPAGVANFYFAKHADGDVASALCYDFGGARYYAHAGTDPERNQKRKGAVALLWWIIIDAKAKGIHTFDYGGVAPDDQPNHPWAGHTRFKKSMGGEIIKLAGTWDYPIRPAKYVVYRAVKRFYRG